VELLKTGLYVKKIIKRNIIIMLNSVTEKLGLDLIKFYSKAVKK